MSKLLAFLKNEYGATAIEYGLIAAGISIAIIATVNALGTTLNTDVQQRIDPAALTRKPRKITEAAGNGGFFFRQVRQAEI